MHLQLILSGLFLTRAVSASGESTAANGGYTGAVTGYLAANATGNGGAVPMRRSITELATEAGPQWDLYVQAMRTMYDRDASETESYFQIAGIHGRPFREYNNAGAKSTDGWSGYSTHGENLFMIWHRPYVAFYEQNLVKEARTLAAAYPESVRSEYQKAAEDLRAPYWDWAAEPSLPACALPESVQVKVAAKTGVETKTIDNPLYTYKFSQDVKQGKYGQFETRDRMYRCDSSEQANENLVKRNYKGLVYDTFTMAKSFSEFATTASKGRSLEAAHNALHWDAGCGGQFMDSQYSAFEPLFMLHHANVDRLWAYWQGMHPEATTFNGAYQGQSRYNTPSGSMIDLDSPLQPFRQTNGEWHTSRSVNSCKNFGYTYQGLEHWSKSETQMQQSAVEIINSLYGPPEQNKPLPPVSPAPSASPARTTTSNNAPVTSGSGSSTQVKPPSTSGGVSSSGMVTSVRPTTSGSSSQQQSTTPGTSSGPSSAGPSSASSLRTTLATSVLPSGNNSVPAPTTTTAPGVKPTLPVFANKTETDYKKYYAGISVDVAYLPHRPCAIDISIGDTRAGGMAIMNMPEKGLVYDSVSLTTAIHAAKLSNTTADGSDLVRQVLSRMQVTLRKPDGSTIDVTQLNGLRVEVEEADVLPAKSQYEMPEVVKAKSHVVVDKPVSGCYAPYSK
ncbi:tyrosinase precursor [Cordyceps fumosorosea ARSEF 2679]|uniref:tyrosinase n=1 Tax=Cordyceps fumosorosea (strain ARSEF 2679) TaxID=1081104 RepID=A0A168D8M7_CORFA|nr:tyrosinase precursor [Cordyceps fumosorosea ARSEF 2679]OAA72295.1 tyrosinase precursor [Cordyceps fumosorosea ARSEF 2679]